MNLKNLQIMEIQSISTFNQGHTRLYRVVKQLSTTLCGKHE
jgi:hypothetical protein